MLTVGAARWRLPALLVVFALSLLLVACVRTPIPAEDRDAGHPDNYPLRDPIGNLVQWIRSRPGAPGPSDQINHAPYPLRDPIGDLMRWARSRPGAPGPGDHNDFRWQDLIEKPA